MDYQFLEGKFFVTAQRKSSLDHLMGNETRYGQVLKYLGEQRSTASLTSTEHVFHVLFRNESEGDVHVPQSTIALDTPWWTFFDTMEEGEAWVDWLIGENNDH